MTRFSSAADLFAAVGTPLGVTGWREVTRADVDAHATATGAPAWVAAGTGPLPGPAVHGAFTLALASPWLAELLALDGYSGVDYGVDRVRFPAPVALGSRLRVHGLLLSGSRSRTTPSVPSWSCATRAPPVASLPASPRSSRSSSRSPECTLGVDSERRGVQRAMTRVLAAGG